MWSLAKQGLQSTLSRDVWMWSLAKQGLQSTRDDYHTHTLFILIGITVWWLCNARFGKVWVLYSLSIYNRCITVTYIETGRYTGLPADQRLSSLCTTTEPDIEDENQCLFNCELFYELPQNKFSDIFREMPQGTDEKLIYV